MQDDGISRLEIVWRLAIVVGPSLFNSAADSGETLQRYEVVAWHVL